jgi:hypothetical protein
VLASAVSGIQQWYAQKRCGVRGASNLQKPKSSKNFDIETEESSRQALRFITSG